jgi:hypothetical protein
MCIKRCAARSGYRAPKMDCGSSVTRPQSEVGIARTNIEAGARLLEDIAELAACGVRELLQQRHAAQRLEAPRVAQLLEVAE